MPKFLVDGAELKCPMGTSSGSLKVLDPKIKGCDKPIANQFDCIPIANIPSFGTCKITKCPCIPATTPWNTSSNVKVRGAPALNEKSSTMCALGGKISPSSPGQSVIRNTCAKGSSVSPEAVTITEKTTGSSNLEVEANNFNKADISAKKTAPPKQSGKPFDQPKKSESARPSTEKSAQNNKTKETAKKSKPGRGGKQKKLRQLADDPLVSSADRGWIKQDMNSIKRGNRKTIRVPPGKELAHKRGKEANRGFSYEHADLQDKDLHKLQHSTERAFKKRKPQP